jgi:hypothetical protein
MQTPAWCPSKETEDIFGGFSKLALSGKHP